MLSDIPQSVSLAYNIAHTVQFQASFLIKLQGKATIIASVSFLASIEIASKPLQVAIASASTSIHFPPVPIITKSQALAEYQDWNELVVFQVTFASAQGTVNKICQSLGKTIRLIVLVQVTVSVLHTVIILFHSIATNQADTLVIEVSEACQSSILHTPIAVAVEAVSQAIGSQVQFVRVQALGVQISGVVSVIQAKVSAALERLIATSVVQI
jgi:hypothetical protein